MQTGLKTCIYVYNFISALNRTYFAFTFHIHIIKRKCDLNNKKHFLGQRTPLSNNTIIKPALFKRLHIYSLLKCKRFTSGIYLIIKLQNWCITIEQLWYRPDPVTEPPITNWTCFCSGLEFHLSQKNWSVGPRSRP